MPTMALLSLLKSCHLIVSLCLVLLSGDATGASSLRNNGISASFNDIPYFISPYSAASLPKDLSGIEGLVEVGGLYPMTVLPNVSSTNFSAFVDSFTAKDDVFQPGFLQSTLTAKTLQFHSKAFCFLTRNSFALQQSPSKAHKYQARESSAKH